MSDLEQFSDWQDSPQGIVAGQVTALTQAISGLAESIMHGERSLYLPSEALDLHLAYRQLGRLLARIPVPAQEASE